MAESVVLRLIPEHGENILENNEHVDEGKLQPTKDNVLRKSRSFGNIMSDIVRLDSNSYEKTHPQVLPEALSQPNTPENTLPSIYYSPGHSLLTICDKVSLKHLSTSTPIMTAQAQLDEPPSPKLPNDPKTYIISKARQKKFMRHFPNVEEDEKVLNHYSCALVSDILLQGHLYITTNYFAFHSNVFGYVTKLLIPVLTVEDITKEKTARIIPNAIGVVTVEDKHIFGSLMSRDSTLRYMRAVWQRTKSASPVIIEPEIVEHDLDSSDSLERESGGDSPTPKFALVKNLISDRSEVLPLERKSSKGLLHTLKKNILEFQKLSRQSLIVYSTSLLLILLFLSAGALMYRISKIQNKYSVLLQDSIVRESKELYSDILQWHDQMHSKSAGAIHDHLDSNLDVIAQVKQSLETLSSLLVDDHSRPTSDQTTPKPLEDIKGQ